MTLRTAFGAKRFWGGILLASFPLLAAIAIGQNLTYQQDAAWQPPQAAVDRPNPLAGKADAVGGGRKIFLRECSECHGSEGSGRKKAADLVLPQVQKQSDGALFWKITNGNARHGMPSFGRLPELQRWQLVLFVRQLSLSPASSSQKE